MTMYFNPQAEDWRLDESFHSPEVLPFHQRLPDYAETPLHRLASDVPQTLGVREILVKDESIRCSLPAYKILGASWGAFRAIAKYLECPPSSSLDDLRHRAREANICLFTATDGNHGRAVARIANILGVKASVFVPRIMLEKTKEFIKGEGAFVTTVNGDYDEAVREADKESRKTGGILIQDTAWPGYEEVPKWIVQGYSTIMIEIDEQLRRLSIGGPSLVVVPIGVGSLGHAVVGHYKQTGRNTRILAVEPSTAACLQASLENGQITTIKTEDTSMCGMNCGTVSYTAWPYLCRGIDASITVTDKEAGEAQEQLRHQGINVGPCGAASMAAISNVCKHHEDVARLTKDAVVVLLATEGPR